MFVVWTNNLPTAASVAFHVFIPLSCNLFFQCVLREKSENELPTTHKDKVQEILILDTCRKDIRKGTKDKRNEGENSTVECSQRSSAKPSYTLLLCTRWPQTLCEWLGAVALGLQSF